MASGLRIFTPTTAGPCKILDVVLGQIIYDNPEINLAKCDIEKSPAYTERFGIQGTLSLYFMMDGEIKKELSGSQPRDVLEEAISQVMFGE